MATDIFQVKFSSLSQQFHHFLPPRLHCSDHQIIEVICSANITHSLLRCFHFFVFSSDSGRTAPQGPFPGTFSLSYLRNAIHFKCFHYHVGKRRQAFYWREFFFSKLILLFFAYFSPFRFKVLPIFVIQCGSTRGGWKSIHWEDFIPLLLDLLPFMKDSNSKGWRNGRGNIGIWLCY